MRQQSLGKLSARNKTVPGDARVPHRASFMHALEVHVMIVAGPFFIAVAKSSG